MGNYKLSWQLRKWIRLRPTCGFFSCISFINFQTKPYKNQHRQISMATHCDRHLTLPKWSNSCSTVIQWFSFIVTEFCTFLRYFIFMLLCFERVGMCGSCVTKTLTSNLKSLLLLLLLFGFFWLCITIHMAWTSDFASLD